MSLKYKKKVSSSVGLNGAFSGHHKTSEAVAKARASKALANAKQRCKNPKNPDYCNYGAKGICMLIAGIDELIGAIGLPKPNESLDRINPHGHYEIGNVRWANAAVQAANKHSSPGNFYLSANSVVAVTKEALALRKNRRFTTGSWRAVLRAFNVGHLPLHYAHSIYEHLYCPGVIEANFDFNTGYDYGNKEPGAIHIPALSLPQARVRIRCFPTICLPAPEHLQRMGRLGGLEFPDPEWNVPPLVWDRLKATVNQKGPGLVFHGQPTTEDLLGGWIEGCFLALAGVIANRWKISAACYPMLSVNSMLDQIGAPYTWDEIAHPLLDARVLLIPDFSLDCGSWGDGKDIDWWKVAKLLKMRDDDGLQTVIGVQNLNKLPRPVKERLLGTYSVIPMPHTKPLSLECMPYSSERYRVPPGTTTLREIRVNPDLARLAVRNGH